MDISSKSVVIVTHQMVYGAAHALRDYLIDSKIPRLLFIAHPINEELRHSLFQHYKYGSLNKKYKLNRFISVGLISYVVDFFISLTKMLTEKKLTIFVGVNNLNCLVGILLKKIGKVETVIYYSIDFTPKRFSSTMVNNLYHRIESYCVRNSDIVWNTSPRIAEGRKKYLKIEPKKYLQKWVPIGVKEDDSFVPYSSINKHQLVFVGHILEKQGVQEVIRAFPIVVKKIPDAKFIIIGGGPYLPDLKNLVTHLRLEQFVFFTGWITDKKKLDTIMNKSALAVATYKDTGIDSDNFSYYADPTKIKEYLNAGLPVVMTNVPYNSHELEREKCGIVVRYNSLSIAEGILILLDEKKNKTYRQNAKKYIRKYFWDEIFDKEFQSLP